MGWPKPIVSRKWPDITVVAVALALLLVLLAQAACAPSGATGGASDAEPSSFGELDALVSAETEKDFSKALVAHGPIREDEMPLILKAIESRSEIKRRNAASLLNFVRGEGDKRLAAQTKVVAETKDVVVWAIVLDALLDTRSGANPSEMAGKRPEMIKAALQSEDGKVLSVGIKAGVLAKYPGIEEAVRKQLNHPDAKVQSAALESLTPEATRAVVPALLKMLEDYDTGAKKYDSAIYTPLAHALAQSEDPKAYAALRASLEKDYVNSQRTGGQRSEADAFYNNAAVITPDDGMYKFLLYLVQERSKIYNPALDALTRQIWAGKRKPTKELMQTCAAQLEASVAKTPPGSHDDNASSCEEMLYFVETGENPISPKGKVPRGADSLKIAQKWLKENGN